jgi:hypothetical protein
MQSLVCITPGKFEVLIKEMLLALKRKVFARAAVNDLPLTVEELQHDCLCYMHYQGKPVKASRLFAGHEYDEQVKRIADHFQQNPTRYEQ